MKNTLLIIFLLSIIFLSCSKTSNSEEPTPAPKALRDVIKFPLGASLNPSKLNQPPYRKVVDDELTSVTAENAMKMAQLHPEAKRYSWADADQIVSVAAKNKQRVFGHALVWHESIPSWVSEFKGNSAAWDSLVRSHIFTVMAYYKGKVNAWDVVNEAFNRDGTWRSTLFREKLGDDYVAKCFKWAREADPSVLLFYNEFGQENSPPKLQATLDMIADFKKRGIPIDGIGLQMHANIGNSDQAIEDAILKSAATGLRVHISELDMAVNNTNIANFVYTDEIKQKQADKFIHIFNTYRKIPAAQQFGITFWNVGDSDSWLRSYFKRQLEYPLLFDDNFARKPAYDKLMIEMQK
jgi:endo-1,4-beta-xylanase